MQVTKVDVTLTTPEPETAPAMVATATVEFDAAFVVKGCKVIERVDGTTFVEMPDRPRKAACNSCRRMIPLTHDYCHRCGAANAATWIGHAFADICHPINRELRTEIDAAVLEAYDQAVSRAVIEAAARAAS